MLLKPVIRGADRGRLRGDNAARQADARVVEATEETGDQGVRGAASFALRSSQPNLYWTRPGKQPATQLKINGRVNV